MTHPATSPDSTFCVVQRGGLDGRTHGVLSSACATGIADANGHTAVPATTAIEAAARRRMRDVGRSIRGTCGFRPARPPPSSGNGQDAGPGEHTPLAVAA